MLSSSAHLLITQMMILNFKIASNRMIGTQMRVRIDITAMLMRSSRKIMGLTVSRRRAQVLSKEVERVSV
jgi:hypothetical protein